MTPTGPSRSVDVLVTGAAGFIGYHLVTRLLKDGYKVAGVDNLNEYYDPTLKRARLSQIERHPRFEFGLLDIADKQATVSSFEQWRPKIVVNLAAQAGVRYSIENPEAYVHSNIVGFANILEMCRQYPVEHLLYASSSSVYGGNVKVPFEEIDSVDHPVSLYAATKRSNELMADCYSHLFSLPSTGLRFFTVYGPYGRPDMAYFGFSDKFFAHHPIRVFNNGDSTNDLMRDFTYVDDVVECIVRLLPLAPSGPRPHEVFNIGGSSPVKLNDFISTLEWALGRAWGSPVEFAKEFEYMKPGDVPTTFADTTRLEKKIGYIPNVTLREGLTLFAEWYIKHFQLKVKDRGQNAP